MIMILMPASEKDSWWGYADSSSSTISTDGLLWKLARVKQHTHTHVHLNAVLIHLKAQLVTSQNDHVRVIFKYIADVVSLLKERNGPGYLFD